MLLCHLSIAIAVVGVLLLPEVAVGHGWYLLVPPLEDRAPWYFPWAKPSFKPDPSQPLRRWRIESSFDKAEQCEERKRAAARAEAFPDAVCVATDDFRLK